jgi:hypothetical protein
MRTRSCAAACLLLTLAVGALAAPAGDKKDPKSPLPGKATWDTRALGKYFDVVETKYDADTREVHWSLETRDAYRTIDLVRDLSKDHPFVFVFKDADGNELATVRITIDKFQGIPKEKVTPKGTAVDLTLEVPDVLDKAKTVTLKRGTGE